METGWQRRRRCRKLNGRVPRVWPVLKRWARVLAVLLLLLCDGWSLQAADHYAGQVDYMAHSPPVVQPPSESNKGVLVGLEILAIVVLVSRLVADILSRRPDTSVPTTAEERQPLDHLYENDPSLVALFE